MGFFEDAGDFLFGKETTVRQKPLQDPLQEQARNLMMNFGKTGQLGGLGYTAGQLYGGQLGDYGMTGLEASGQNKLAGLMRLGMPTVYSMGTDTLKDILSSNSSFDPYNDRGIYGSFKANVMREAGDAQDRINREAAKSGNFSSSSRMNQTRQLGESVTNTLANKMSELYDTFAQRKIGAVDSAMQAAQLQESVDMGRINASQAIGGLQRLLNDQKLKDQYNDYVRTRGEYQDQIGKMLSGLGQVGQGVNWGVEEMTLPSNGGFLGQLLGGVAGGFGQGMGMSMGSSPWMTGLLASSRSFKKEIEPNTVVDSVGMIKGLEMVTYKYKGEDKKRIGIIAEDAPDMLTTEDKTHLDVVNLFGTLLDAVQKLTLRIEKLEAGRI